MIDLATRGKALSLLNTHSIKRSRAEFDAQHDEPTSATLASTQQETTAQPQKPNNRRHAMGPMGHGQIKKQMKLS
jgi:hypothetical protein